MSSKHVKKAHKYCRVVYELSIRQTMKWWEPGNPLKSKVANVATAPTSISKEVSVPTVYSVGNFNIPRIESLLKLLPRS